MEWFNPSIWMGLGIALFLAEILLPGVFLLWIGLAALLVGGATYFIPLAPWAQLLLFSVFSFIGVLLGKRFYKNHPNSKEQETLNNRGSLYVGQTFVVTVEIKDGRGKAKVGDTQWIVEGPDLPEGTRVKVVSVEGTILRVEPFNQ